MKNSTVTFRQMVLRIMIPGYVLILLVLGFYSQWLVKTYQRSVTDVGTSLADFYNRELMQEISGAEETVLKFYLQDDMGLLMESSKDPMQQFSLSHDYSNLFRETISNQEAVSAFLLFYDGFRKCRYNAVTAFDGRKIEAAKAVVYENCSAQDVNRGWYMVNYGAEHFLMYVYGRRGVLIAEVLNYDVITRSLESPYSTENVEIIYADAEQCYQNAAMGEILGLPDADGIEAGHYQRENYLLFPRKLGSTPLTFYLALATGQRNSVWFAILFAVALILVTVASALIVYRLFRDRMMVPLDAMSETLREIGAGNQEVRMDENQHLQEYRTFAKTFNEMRDRIGTLTIEAYEERLAKEKADLQSLRLQIKPHFYLNCLTTIYALAQQKKYDKLEENILTVSDYLRYSFKDHFQPVLLADEIKFAEDTVRIRKDGYHEGIELILEVAAGAGNAQVLPMSVQTFVENSIKYADTDGPLVIRVQAERIESDDGDLIDITVSDNGRGYSEEWLQKLNSNTFEQEHETHIGIFNLKRRLQLMYGDKVEFMVWNSDGAVSEILHPARLPQDAE